jgi:hypothetical protein
MKIIAAALVALSALSATSGLAQAQDWDHHHRDWHRHHGPVIIVEHNRHRDWERHHWHHVPPHHHEYHS